MCVFIYRYVTYESVCHFEMMLVYMCPMYANVLWFVVQASGRVCCAQVEP